jgi:glutaconate CoA-transferase subunit A
MTGSDLPSVSGLRQIDDPYTGQPVYAVPRHQPDWAILHVAEADEDGNARIYGSIFWDRIMSRAACGVIISAERIVSRAELARQPELTQVPGLFVRAVVQAPGGALPCSSSPDYEIDRAGVEAYLGTVGDPAALAVYLDEQDRPLREDDGPILG